MQEITLSGLKDIAEDFDLFLIDIWGVLHNGQQAFPAALDCLKALQKAGKTTVLLSNAPRRLEMAKQKLADFGILPTLYNDIYTSGEDCHIQLRDRQDPWYRVLGGKLFHIGPKRDRSIFEGLPLKEVSHYAEADFLLNTGTDTWDRTLDDYEELLQNAVKLNLPMVCANPDKVVNYGGQLVLCSGAIAQRYETLGGHVHYHGKPFPTIYTNLFTRLNSVSLKNRTIAIGDSLSTDIRGANRAAIASVWILSGIHEKELAMSREKEALFETYQAEPTYCLNALSW